MRTNLRLKKRIIRKGSIVLVIAILMVTITMSTASISSFKTDDLKVSNTENIVYSFAFIEPELQTAQVDSSQYTTLQMPGCMAIGKQAGAPMLPVKSVKLLIPAMKTVRSVNVVGNSVELTSIETPVYPYQNPVPIGFEQEEFRFNTALYASDLLYPSDIYDGYHIGYCRGYAILDITLNPVQYIPGEGRLFYYPEITVTVNLEKTGHVNPFFRNNLDDKTWVENLVYNPEVATSYTGDIPTFEYPGGLCDPSDDYDYVIITTTHNGLDYWETGGTTLYNWDSLMDKHEQDDGLKCTLVTIQDINACSDYYNSDPLFNDTEAHIREFCKDAYGDWGTEYIFIGGDDEWIPARHMKYEYYKEQSVDSDIYWSNLDDTFNDDHDSYWGEEGDTGFDLYSELFIGRITCDTPQDVSNWMTKSFYYADSDDIDYLENAAFYGGDVTWACQGDDFIDYSAIKGTDNWLGPSPGAHGMYPSWLGFQYGFETWNDVNPDNEYNLSVKWTAEPPNPGWQGGSQSVAIVGLKNAINNDQVTLISGIAHANAQMSLDVGMSSWESDYHNTKPFFIHDYGCHCGDMDAADDGVLHSMLFHSDTELAFACVYNTCFGWGSFDDTNSSSYFFDVANNSGGVMNWQLGKAMAYSKDTMAPTINWTYSSAPGSWRGVIQGCLLFGDPAQRIKTMTKPPERPERPEGQTGGIVEVEYPFTTRTTDPDGDQVYYLWDWDDGNFSDWLGPFDSGDAVLASHSWADAETYEIRVKAKDIHNVESGWSDPLTIYIVAPVLEIGNISGGLAKVSAVIKNNGSADVTGVDWSIILDGGFIPFGKETSGRIISIPARGAVIVKSDLIFGFGRVGITVAAEPSYCFGDEKHADGFVLGPFVFIVDGTTLNIPGVYNGSYENFVNLLEEHQDVIWNNILEVDENHEGEYTMEDLIWFLLAVLPDDFFNQGNMQSSQNHQSIRGVVSSTRTLGINHVSTEIEMPRKPINTGGKTLMYPRIQKNRMHLSYCSS